MKFCTQWKFRVYHRIFDLTKVPPNNFTPLSTTDTLTPLFPLSPTQTDNNKYGKNFATKKALFKKNDLKS